MSISNIFPEFDYNADQLSKFIATADIVTIMLRDGKIIHYTPKNMPLFLKWLSDHKIPNIKK